MPPAPFRDIAIIGIACRFPGAPNLEAFWNNLIGGIESIIRFSDEELRAAGIEEYLLSDPHYVKVAPVIDEHDGFDAAFFGYSPREARLMDPQQRHFLEVVWAALEDAGYDPLGDKGIVGIYAGAGGMVSSYVIRHDHPELRGQTGDLGHIGNDRDFLPSRVAFKLDLTGPAVNVQTACSTSLVAVHLACRALIDGEAEMAIAGAAVVRVPHLAGYLAEPGGIDSPDGHCRAFDAEGSGTLFGSGVAAIVLKPLQSALAHNDHIYAVIKGSAVTNDGAVKVNYTASTVTGQARAMTEALAVAGVDADTISYVECHGTATTIGDPLEIQALTRAFRTQTQRTQYCAIGSVKSNFGHLEQCAGLAGLIKTVLALDRGLIPPSLHFNTPNPRIPFQRSPFFVNTALLPFQHHATPRRAAVNSVGMGGTNAFAVLEEAPAQSKRAPSKRPVFALALSAKSAPALAAQVANIQALLTTVAAPELCDLCFTMNCGRHHFEQRVGAVGADANQLAAALERFASEPQSQSLTAPDPITFLYSGQGSQYARMGEALYRDNRVFAETLDYCFQLFEAEGISLREPLFGDDEDRLTWTLYAQPALFSLQVALTELWKSWGIAPDIVIGHSIGEFAAAVVGNVCTIEAAARLVATRARLMEELPQHGAMVSIAAASDTVRALLAEAGDELAIAAENAPDRLVLSGANEAVNAIISECTRRGIPAAPLKTSHAFHSHLMDPMLARFAGIAAKIAVGPPKIRWISTLTGEEMGAAPDAGYWGDQIRHPVRFRRAIETAAAHSATFLEIGPGTTLTTLGRRCLPDRGLWLSSLGRRGEDWRNILEALGKLYRQGRTISWQAVEQEGGRRISLPTYPFQHERYWLESRKMASAAAAPSRHRAEKSHPLLGDRLGGEEASFEGLLSLQRFGFLGDHRVTGRAVLPTAAILDAVSAAAERHFGFSNPVIEDFVYERALTIPDRQPLWTMVSLETTQEGTTFRLQSTGMSPDDSWLLHAGGIIRDDPQFPALPAFPVHRKRAATEIPTNLFYRFLDRIGLSYGAAFRGIRALWRDRDQVFANVALPSNIDQNDGYGLHPAFLDACLHVYAALVSEHGLFEDQPPAAPYVPLSIDAFCLYRAGAERALVHGSLVGREDDKARLKVDIAVYGEDGGAIALLRGLTVGRVSEEMLTEAETLGHERLLYAIDWREAPAVEPVELPVRHWYVVTDQSGVGQQLGHNLAAEGATVVTLSADAPGLENLLDEVPQGSVGIVYLRALDAPADFDGPASLSRRTELICGGLLDLAKALERVRDRFPEPPRLWLATRSVDSAPAQGLLWGLGRSFALEYPEMWGGLADLPAEATVAEAAGLLLRELRARDGENQVRCRAGKRLVPRFVPLAFDGNANAVLSGNATYWIIGGLGRLGLQTAEALIKAGARYLALSGRSEPDARAAAAIETLAQRAEIRVVLADIADAAALGAALSQIRKTMPPLRGVIHAAAVFEDALLANADWGLFERVLAPKVLGAWNLHRVTLGLDLDFFILFSSVLSLWGAAGQSAYTAANSFLDSLAHYRRAQGLPATVLNWGPWEDLARWGAVGAALWRQRGTTALPPSICFKILLSQLGGGPPQIAVTDTRWEDFLAQFADVPLLFREMASATRSIDIPSTPADSGTTRRAQAEKTIAAHAGRVLGLSAQIDPAQPLNELGLDSLLAVTLANRLRRAFDRAVPTAVLLKGPSVNELAAQLFPELGQVPEQAEPAAAPTAWIAGNRWLVIHRPNPGAALRLVAFPFAGGGAATFRPWVDQLDPAIELIAIEPPGRQTRIDELPIRNLEPLLRQLVPELLPFLDKPFAVYGHCLGALTLFETVRRLIRGHGMAPAHIFVSGARPPDELQRQQDFEEALIDRLLKLPEYNLFEPIYRQPDEVFSEAIRRFNVLATESLVQDAELRRLILPAIRAEFEMASNYRYDPEEPWDVPITCLTGAEDAYVSAENARSWARFTKRRFQLYTLDSEHFIVVDDDRFLLQIINRELMSLV